MRGLDIRFYNMQNAISISGSSGCAIEGNYIIQNRRGISIGFGVSNRVGGLNADAGNVISSNAFDGAMLSGNNASNQLQGINVSGSETHHNRIIGNIIGLNAFGSGLAANNGDGIRFTLPIDSSSFPIRPVTGPDSAKEKPIWDSPSLQPPGRPWPEPSWAMAPRIP